MSHRSENTHPYHQYEGTQSWKIVDTAISDLAANQDIKETTARGYIVGYLVKSLAESGVLTEKQP